MYVCMFVGVGWGTSVSSVCLQSTRRSSHQVTAATHSVSGQWVWTEVWLWVELIGKLWSRVYGCGAHLFLICLRLVGVVKGVVKE